MANKNAPECEGNKYWWQDGEVGQYHRLDGPAIEQNDGAQSWQANGKFAYSWGEYQEITNCSDNELTIIVMKYGPFNCDLNPPEALWRISQERKREDDNGE